MTATVTVKPRAQRRAVLEARKAAVRKRHTRLAWEYDEDGNQVWYLWEPGLDAVGIEANTPVRCGKWCVCRDRGQKYSREAFKQRTAREMEEQSACTTSPF